MKCILWKTNLFLLLMGCSALNSAFATMPDMAPPKIQLVDEFGVNLFTGQVTTHLETVSIGGAMGLSHSISAYTNNFSSTGMKGYHDKYRSGRGRAVVIKQPMEGLLDVMRVDDFIGTTDFIVMVNGQMQSVYTTATNYTYQALGDARHTLERRADGNLYWTKPDGTVSKFHGGGAADVPNRPASSAGALLEVQYPNGFTIRTGYAGAISNTGFALKYIYQFDEEDRYFPSGGSNQIPQAEPENWAQANPKYVQAINMARENCVALEQSCSGNWPRAEFDWPAGMPRAKFIGTSMFKVIDATGGVTTYHFRAFDLAYDDYGNLIAGQTPGQRFSPRLVAIKPASSDFISPQYYQYAYRTQVNMGGSNDATYVRYVETAGVIKSAQMGDRTNGYLIGEAHYATIRNAGGGTILEVIPNEDKPGTLSFVRTNTGGLNYENNYRNFPLKYNRIWGDTELYEYAPAGRGNLTKVTKGGTVMTAEYPASCTPATRKICNKPMWTSDAKGNKTHYTYHAESGEISTITYPANKAGKVAQTRYGYEQKQAQHHYTLLLTPIWLKTSESYCVDSHYSNACAGGDEVVTRYEYNHDNLFMTGMTVYSQKDNKTLRSCYEYDDYGNRIGETQPKANLSSCD